MRRRLPAISCCQATRACCWGPLASGPPSTRTMLPCTRTSTSRCTAGAIGGSTAGLHSCASVSASTRPSAVLLLVAHQASKPAFRELGCAGVQQLDRRRQRGPTPAQGRLTGAGNPWRPLITACGVARWEQRQAKRRRAPGAACLWQGAGQGPCSHEVGCAASW